MKLLDKFLCAVGRHELTTWRKVVGVDGTVVGPATPLTSGLTFASLTERHCKRPGCKYYETKRVRARKSTRPANEADTVQKAGQ